MDDAAKIRKAVDDFGIFLEVANPGLMKVFGTQIPQSVLPHNKEIIVKGLDVFARILSNKGDEEGVGYIQGCQANLAMYVEDDVALSALRSKS